MSGYCKNRTFRSAEGCCICRAKSSTSRFTESKRYEESFQQIFFLEESRSGDICNACVLIIKRFWAMNEDQLKNKQDEDLATFGEVAMWSYMVDSRIGPGTKSVTKIKNKLKEMAAAGTGKSIQSVENGSGHTDAVKTASATSTTSSNRSLPPNECKKKFIPKKCRRRSKICNKTKRKNLFPKKRLESPARTTYTSSLDMKYWKPLDICCGKIFIGQNQEVFVVQELFKSCRGNTCTRPGGTVSPTESSCSAYTGSPAQGEEQKDGAPKAVPMEI